MDDVQCQQVFPTRRRCLLATSSEYCVPRYTVDTSNQQSCSAWHPTLEINSSQMSPGPGLQVAAECGHLMIQTVAVTRLSRGYHALSHGVITLRCSDQKLGSITCTVQDRGQRMHDMGDICIFHGNIEHWPIDARRKRRIYCMMPRQ